VGCTARLIETQVVLVVYLYDGDFRFRRASAIVIDRKPEHLVGNVFQHLGADAQFGEDGTHPGDTGPVDRRNDEQGHADEHADTRR
jgi:hypothetical protein